MDKKTFIAEYLNKHMKKFENMDYGIQWLNRYAETEEKAEKAWKRKLKVKRRKK